MSSAARLIGPLLVATAIAAGTSASAATTWTDPVGDVEGVQPAPDIASVAVSQTLERVALTVRLDPAGAPYSHGAADTYADLLRLLLDRDRNGRASEDDFLAVHAAATPAQVQLALLGPTGDEPKRTWTLPAASSASTVAVSLSKIALGNPSTIRFRAEIERRFGEDEIRAGSDACPDDGTYAARLTPIALRAIRLPSIALRPRAGRTLSLSGIRGVTASGKRVALTRVSATARIGGRALRPVERRAVSWRIPAAARGKTVVLRVTGRFGAAARTATWRLRVG